jgi:hypothetical protein
MRVDELWVEAYQGEVLGETLFRALADRETDPARRRQLEVLALLERATKDLAEPVFTQRAISHGDTAATVAAARQFADAAAAQPWEEFLTSIAPVTARYLELYRELVDLAATDEERAIAEAYVAHEEALAAYGRRALGMEPGDPLAPILALPHVAVAA